MENGTQYYDAILVPGGGLRNRTQLPLWSQRRFDRLIELHRGGVEYRRIITLSAGTTHKPPPVDDSGFPIFESLAGAAYLVRMGISPGKILTETSSYDTIGNAYFSRFIHVEPGQFKKLLVITSAFHMPRTRAIFEWVYRLSSEGTQHDYVLHFDEAPDKGVDKEILEIRKEKEQASLQKVLRLSERLTTLPQFHRWLFSEHEAYAVGLNPGKIDGKIAATY